MNNQILERINFDFDIKNHCELSPIMFFSDISLKSYLNSKLARLKVKDYHHFQMLDNTLNSIEKIIYFDNLYQAKNDKNKIFLTRLYRIIENQSRSAIENQFSIQNDVLSDLINDSQRTNKKLSKIYKRCFKQMPISTAMFPHYHKMTTNYFFYDDAGLNESNNNSNNILQTEQKLSEIIDKYMENDKEQKEMISINDLFNFLDILSSNTKAFSFSPSFVLSMIERFDNFLNTLFSLNEKTNIDFAIFNEIRKLPNNDDSKTKIKYFYVIMLIKMIFNLIIQKIHEALAILLQFIILEQEGFLDLEQENISFKSIFEKSLPKTIKRSKIIQNISSDQILDFYCSQKGNNDFILTKEGIFRIDQENNLIKIEINSQIAEDLLKSDKYASKITFSDGILYVLSQNDKTIHKILISNEESNLIEEQNNQIHRIIQNENSIEKKKKKRLNKRLREKQRKEKKAQRKKERKEIEKNEINLDSILVDIPELPIISIGFYDNYFRILQQKSYENGKTTFVLTNVDLTPNSRTHFDVIESFEKVFNQNEIKQTQVEFTINDKNSKYQLSDACFSQDIILFSFEDSSFEQWMIFHNGTVDVYKHSLSPYLFSSQSKIKMDNDSFLHIMEPIKNHSINFVKMYLPETKYYIRSDKEIFMKHHYLQNISDIVDNCSHFIINKEVTKNITTEEYFKANEYSSRKKNDKKVHVQSQTPKQKPNQFSFVVSPEEMSTIVQSPTAISQKLDELKELIKELKDDELKRFFATLFIKMCGINLLYGTRGYYSTKEKLNEEATLKFKKFRSFITDLLTLIKSSDNEIIIQESFIFTISLVGKFLFFPDHYDELHDILDNLLYLKDDNENNQNECSKFLLRTLSYFMFSFPSSLYIINDSVINQLIRFDNVDININELFMNSSIFIYLENRFAFKVMNIKFTEFISPYIQSAFNYLYNLLINNSVSLNKIEQILACFISFYFYHNYTSQLMITKEFTKLAPFLYDRIRNEPGVIESDNEFLEHFDDVHPKTVYKEVKVLESEHPYSLDAFQNTEIDSKGNMIIDLGIIDFGTSVDTIYAVFDNRCKLSGNDKIKFYYKNDKSTFCKKDDFNFNQAIKIESNELRVKLIRKKNSENNEPFWGYKITFYGISFENQFNYVPNTHLFFYNTFLCALCNSFVDAYRSTESLKKERDIEPILKNKIIQGIKFEEVENNENPSYNISRGISFDIDKESTYDDNLKQSFLEELINAKDEDSTLGKKFLDVLYSKTAKKNRIRLNDYSKSILENEHYLAACLIKHLGLVNTCLKFIKTDEINDEVPSCLQTIWKKVYSLRQTLFLSYQKSKSLSKSKDNKDSIKLNFKQYSQEIKNKCFLLLCSDPILKIKVKEDFTDKKIESIAASIFSFIISDISLSKISEFIDIRKERLSIMMKALSLISDFFDHNSMFESSKHIVSNQIYFQSSINKILGVNQAEFDEYHKLFEEFTFKFMKNIFTNPSTALLSKMEFFGPFVFSFYEYEDINPNYDCSPIFFDVIERNKNNTTIIHDITNIYMIANLLSIALKKENNKLVDSITSFLLCDHFDLKSKRLILAMIPLYIRSIKEDMKIKDQSFALSFLENNSNSPILVRSAFYWIAASINNDMNQRKENYDFIMKVLRGIGQSFVGKSCLFINDYFQPFAHRQVSEGMISFIRLLVNFRNETMLKVIHDIFTNKITHIQFSNTDFNDDIMILIGLFSSVGHSLSAFEPERKFITHKDRDGLEFIIGFNPTTKKLRRMDSFRSNFNRSFGNCVPINPDNLDFNDIEMNNILQLHEMISKSKYFAEKQNYNFDINDVEIGENMLIASFYSFLPIILQNKNNAGILMNSNNLIKSLSLFDFATNSLPSNENTLLLLSHYLENAINNPMFKGKRNIEDNRVDSKGCFRFLKMNFGEIIYNNDFDVIKTNRDHHNMFISSRPFRYDYETYFELKINNIGNKQIFIGFVDSEEKSINKAFGFGCAGQSEFFCRRSANLAKCIEFSADKIMQNDQNPNRKTNKDKNKVESEQNKGNDNSEENKNKSEESKDENNQATKEETKICFSLQNGDRIGCYYTFDYVYLTLNGVLTKYRLFHKSVDSYIPIISVDHDEVELEITQNVTIVDKSNCLFNFLTIPNDEYFGEKDIKNSKRNTDSNNKSEDFIENNAFIGQIIYIDRTISLEKDSYLETIDPMPPNILNARENFGIIKDIIPNDENRFISKINIETYNNLTLSKEIFNNVDSRYLSYKKTNFFNLLENRTNTKLGLNNDFNLNYLPKELQLSSDFNSISNYLRTKTIIDNSKSIAIIMTRYLVFVLIDYLRYIKSPLLQDEGIESDEMKCILNSLATSLPTISSFRPKFAHQIDKDEFDNFAIFKDENKDEEENSDDLSKKTFIPGYATLFDTSFKVFLKKSESFMSTKFITKLLKISIDKAMSYEIPSISSLYSLIQPKCKIESVCPLPKKFEYETTIKKKILKKNVNSVGFIPILLNKIPDELPEIVCNKINCRESSDQITYFSHIIDEIEMSWKYDIKEIKEDNNDFNLEKYNNYKLKFGLLLLPKNLPENLLNSSLGFIQILLNIFQSFSNSDVLFDKFKEFLRCELLQQIFALAMKKDPLLYPFLQIIIVMLISKYGFSDSMFCKNASNALFLFQSISNKLYQMTEFPTGKNELPLLFSIYSNLIQTRIFELLDGKQNKETVSVLFDKYNDINKELFKIDDTNNEVKSNKKKNDILVFNENEKKKNFRLLYILYYYSYLLHNDHYLPYPMFLFVHDLMMQHFGGFRTAISTKDINRFSRIKTDENKEIIYKSDVLENDFDLSCSYKLFNIYETKELDEKNNDNNKSKKENNNKDEKEKIIRDANKVFIHQLNDDKHIELPQSGESVTVSFPLEIIIIHEKDTEKETKELKIGDVYIVEFNPSESTQRSYFIDNYEQIKNDFQQFISLEKYDSQIMEALNNNNKIINEQPDIENNNNEINDNSSYSENDESNDNSSTSTGDNDDDNIDSYRKEYKILELPKIPLNSNVSVVNHPESISKNIVSLRCSMILRYRFLIENLIVTYTVNNEKEGDDDKDCNSYSNWWRKSPYSDEKAPNKYMEQIVGPAYSMATESKFIFINNILRNETKEDYKLQLIFNRFEQQKYFENVSKSARPLFIQFMEQIDEDSIQMLKVRGSQPFVVKLVGEGAIDAGGPAREIFSSLIVEMMNDKLGIFTYNPNRLRNNKDTNMEDLIPNKKVNSDNFSDENAKLLNKRFVYAGALLAVCIVSSLPQTMKLSNIIWEYLTKGSVSIESIYEIDDDFRKIIKKAESLENKMKTSSSQMTDDEFNNCFNHFFEIKDSSNDIIELIPSGSKIPVTKETLHEFIQLAKKQRLTEFDDELKEMKEGFDKIMIYKNIASILTPKELKLLICGETNCNIEQMKKIIEISTPSLHNEKINEEQMKTMFWNVMESFSVDERMQFIRFSSGNLGLPAPGLKWDENINVFISSREKKEKEKKTLVTSSTCSSEARIPFFESEEELAKMIRISLKFFGMISDNRDELEEISTEFF